jgi:hypothetical protein
MPTAFKQPRNNARSTQTASTTAIATTFTLQTGDGAKFPTPGNGFWVTAWDKVTYPKNPADDPSMEICLCTARATDVLTVVRGQLTTPTASTHAAGFAIELLDLDQYLIDIQTSVNALENAPAGAKASWAIIAASGGDYTTLGAAYTAGARNFLVTPGTYNEATGTLSAWIAAVNIVGTNRETCIIQLASGNTGLMAMAGAGCNVRDITIKDGTAGLTNHYDGYVTVTANNCNFDNVLFLGQDSATNIGASVALKNGSNGVRFLNCEWRNSSVDGGIHMASVSGVLVESCKFALNQGYCIGMAAAAATPGGTIEKIRIAGCYFNNSGSGSSIKSANIGGVAAQALIITGNHLLSTGTAAVACIAVQSSGSGLTNDSIVISNNIVENEAATGKGCITASSSSGIVVSNNICLKVGTGLGDAAIYLGASVGFSCIGNQVTCTAASTSGMTGIAGGTSDGTISGNFITGFLGAASLGIDLSYQGNVRTSVTGNHITNCTTGINASTGSNVCFNNVFSSTVTTPYKVGAGSTILRSGLVLTKSAAYTVTQSDDTILADATAAAFTVTVPAATLLAGKTYTVKKKDVSANAVTVGATIDGVASPTLAAQYNTITFYSDGTGWYKVSSI